MMRRLRHATVRTARRTPDLALWFAAICALGLGWQAARDWHHHGELGTGFFHLHFHVGGHHHDHAGDHHHEDGEKAPASPDHRGDPPSQSSRFFTVAQGATELEVSSPWIEGPEMLRQLRDERAPRPRDRGLRLSPSSPRAPPA